MPIPKDMLGKQLGDAIAEDRRVHDYALFGAHGGTINITDGRYVYMRAPRSEDNDSCYEYTLMPTHMNFRFTPDELRQAALGRTFTFTKGCPTLKIPTLDYLHVAAASMKNDDLLFDLENDPGELHPIEDEAVRQRMTEAMIRLMRENDAPDEQYERMGLRT